MNTDSVSLLPASFPRVLPGGLRALVVGVMAGVLALLLALSAAPGPASAHGGPFGLTVAPDGAGGLTVIAAYTEDGHPVSEVIDPVATAVAADGRTAGPVSLVSSGEGEGVWVTAEPFLGEGDWAVTVTTTTPSSATATAQVTVAPLAPPVAPEDAGVPISTTDDQQDAGAEAAPAAADAGGVSPVTVVLWIAAVAVVLAVVLLVLRRRGVIRSRR